MQNDVIGRFRDFAASLCPVLSNGVVAHPCARQSGLPVGPRWGGAQLEPAALKAALLNKGQEPDEASASSEVLPPPGNAPVLLCTSMLPLVTTAIAPWTLEHAEGERMVWKHLYTTALHTHLVSVVYATLFSATALPKKFPASLHSSGRGGGGGGDPWRCRSRLTGYESAA